MVGASWVGRRLSLCPCPAFVHAAPDTGVGDSLQKNPEQEARAGAWREKKLQGQLSLLEAEEQDPQLSWQPD